MEKWNDGALVRSLLPVALAVAVLAFCVYTLFRDVTSMKRVAINSDAQLTLTPGAYVVYAERPKTTDGVAYGREALNVRCRLDDVDGASIELDHPSVQAEYSIAGYTGRSVFQFAIRAGGSYHLRCKGDRGVMAIGPPSGRRILGVFIGGGTVVAALGMFLKRRRQRGSLSGRSHRNV